MYEAQQIFGRANRLSRPEKAVILGFIAGSRENPYPNRGNIIEIVVSEAPHNENGEILQTYLELNYLSGTLHRKQRLVQLNANRS